MSKLNNNILTDNCCNIGLRLKNFHLLMGIREFHKDVVDKKFTTNCI